MNRRKFDMQRLLILIGLLAWSAFLPAQDGPIVEIQVLGRQPGPPMWLVKHGENELWIFAHLSPVPKGMVWESDKVAAVIARAEETIGYPDVDVKASPLLYLNPVNIFRGVRLAKRLRQNPDGKSLQQELPPELYARFAVLKQRYFPKDRDIEKLRPLMAGGQMTRSIQQQAGLVQATDVTKQIQRLKKRNRGLQESPVEVRMDVKGSYKSLAKRAEDLVDSLPRDLELACFEFQLHRMETDVREMQLRAESWARGYIDEFKGVPLPRDDEGPCMQMAYSSSEQETIRELRQELEQRWLEVAEVALGRSRTTFAVLDISELLSPNGLIAQLSARGYEVHEP
jgi:hypothetical protein